MITCNINEIEILECVYEINLNLFIHTLAFKNSENIDVGQKKSFQKF